MFSFVVSLFLAALQLEVIFQEQHGMLLWQGKLFNGSGFLSFLSAGCKYNMAGFSQVIEMLFEECRFDLAN